MSNGSMDKQLQNFRNFSARRSGVGVRGAMELLHPTLLTPAKALANFLNLGDMERNTNPLAKLVFQSFVSMNIFIYTVREYVHGMALARAASPKHPMKRAIIQRLCQFSERIQTRHNRE